MYEVLLKFKSEEDHNKFMEMFTEEPKDYIDVDSENNIIIIGKIPENEN